MVLHLIEEWVVDADVAGSGADRGLALTWRRKVGRPEVGKKYGLAGRGNQQVLLVAFGLVWDVDSEASSCS